MIYAIRPVRPLRLSSLRNAPVNADDPTIRPAWRLLRVLTPDKALTCSSRSSRTCSVLLKGLGCPFGAVVLSGDFRAAISPRDGRCFFHDHGRIKRCAPLPDNIKHGNILPTVRNRQGERIMRSTAGIDKAAIRNTGRRRQLIASWYDAGPNSLDAKRALKIIPELRQPFRRC